METRPELNTAIAIEDFREFYWLKAELIQFCRKEGLSLQGGKIEIASRIETYLKTGEKAPPNKNKKPKPISKFDWNNENLTLATIITDNYKNSENVRTFFQENLGAGFKFNVKFMNWMKQNAGKTLADAVNAWHAIKLEQKNKPRKEIAPQFEYNRYIRDFLEDNPDKSKKEAIRYWKIKRSMRGDNKYRKSDLDFE